MTVSTFVPTAAGSQSVNSYTAAIDGNFAVLVRLGVTFAPHAQPTPNMTVALNAGHIFSGTTLTEVAAQNTATITAPSTNPRIDRVVVSNTTGVVSVVTGTPNITPVPPTIPSGNSPIAQVLLQSTTTAITNDLIVDERDLTLLGSSSPGSLIGIQKFDTPGSTTYTPSTGTTKIIVDVQGGGGAGGSVGVTGGSVACAGSGGDGGAFSRQILTSGFSGATVVTGTAGQPTAPSNAYGNSGGNSSFGTVVAPGGLGGRNMNTGTAGPTVTGIQVPPTDATGGLINTEQGAAAQGIVLSANSTLGGNGGCSFYGSGGSGYANGVGSHGARAPGAGGGGASNVASSSSTTPGGQGSAGLVIVYEFA